MKMKLRATFIVSMFLLLGDAHGQEGVVGYDNGFFVRSPDNQFKLVVGGYFQSLFQGDINEAAADTDTFRVRRARLKFSGHAFTSDLTYNLLYEFASNQLADAELGYRISDSIKFRAGQFKIPYNLEALNSGTALQLVDRSIVHSYFGVQNPTGTLTLREPGFGFSGSVRSVDYSLSVSNGEGPNTLNANNEMRYAGRVMYNLMGKVGEKTFSDVKPSEGPNLGFGFAGMYNDTPNAAATMEQKIYSLTSDLTYRNHGLGCHGAYFFQRTDPDTGATFTDHGVLVQAGYEVLSEKLEVAARFARIFRAAANDTAEYTVGLNYWIYNGHQVKFQIDYSALQEKNGIAAGNDRLNHRARVQLQISI